MTIQKTTLQANTRMRLRKTLLVFMTPLLVIPVALLGYLAYYYSNALRTHQVYKQVNQHLQQQQLFLNDFLRLQQARLSFIASSSLLKDYLTDTNALSESQVSLLFQDVIQQDNALRSIKLLQLDGAERLSYPHIEHSNSLPNRLRNEYFSNLQAMIEEQSIFFAPEGPERQIQLFFAQKIYQPEKSASKSFWGYLLIVVDPEPFATVVMRPITANSVTLLLSRAGTIAYAANQALLGSAFTPSHYRTIQKSLDQEMLTEGLLLGEQRLLLGRTLIGSYKLVYGVDNKEISSYFQLWPLWIVGGSLLSCILVPWLMYKLLTRQVLLPVKQLTAAKTAVGRGDLSIVLDAAKQDELGEMFAAFNVMVRQLRVYRERELASKQDLEEKVLRRTQDLAQANDDLAAANQELTTAREIAEQANRLKSVFLANMSHEIRTPLTAVIGFSQQALIECDPQQRSDYLKRVLRSSEHLLGLINDILDLSKIEADKLELNTEAFNYLAMLEDIYQQTSEQASAKGLDCQLQLHYPLPVALYNDSLRVRQVLLNLTSNAVKFTRRGKIIIGVHYDERQLTLTVSIKDTGIGMTNQEISRLFQPFVQADATVTRDFGGTGLGLCISKKLMEQMNGDITVESVKGIGSNFAVSFKFEQAPQLLSALEPVMPDVTPEPLQSEPIQMHVLVAEDNADNQILLTLMLRQLGVSFEVVSNGHLAVERVLNCHFDLVFMDMQMPVMGGEEATRLLRHAGISVPIVALTANVMSEDAERYRQAGCQAVLAKPIVQSDFLNTITRFNKVKVEKEHSLTLKLAKDPAMQALLKQFREQLPTIILELRMLVRRQAWSELAFAAHSLKGSAGSMGFPTLTLLAGELESAAAAVKEDVATKLVEQMEHEYRLASAEQPATSTN